MTSRVECRQKQKEESIQKCSSMEHKMLGMPRQVKALKDYAMSAGFEKLRPKVTIAIIQEGLLQRYALSKSANKSQLFDAKNVCTTS